MPRKKRKRHALGKSRKGSEERDLRFAEVYMGNGENARRAYMEVFDCINENTAAVEGHKVLKKPKVHDYITKRRAEMRARYALTPDRVYQEIARVAYYSPKGLLDKKTGKPLSLHEIDDDVAAALDAVEIQVGDNGQVTFRSKPHDKNSALEKACKLLRLYDAPPPPPPDESGNVVARSPQERAKWLAFLLARGAAAKALENKS